MTTQTTGTTLATIAVDADHLLSALKWVEPCIAKDSTRPALEHVFLSIKADTMTVVGADSFRLARYVVPVSLFHALSEQIGILVDVGALKAALKGTYGRIELLVTDDNLIVNGTPIHRYTDRSFPNWELIVPRNNAPAIEFDRRARMALESACSVAIAADVPYVRIVAGEQGKVSCIIPDTAACHRADPLYDTTALRSEIVYTFDERSARALPTGYERRAAYAPRLLRELCRAAKRHADSAPLTIAWDDRGHQHKTGATFEVAGALCLMMPMAIRGES